MWFLLLTVWLVIGDEPYKTTPIEKYDTKEECESERVRITEAMDESYPEEKQYYTLRCEERETNPKLPL